MVGIGVDELRLAKKFSPVTKGGGLYYNVVKENSEVSWVSTYLSETHPRRDEGLDGDGGKARRIGARAGLMYRFAQPPRQTEPKFVEHLGTAHWTTESVCLSTSGDDALAVS